MANFKPSTDPANLDSVTGNFRDIFNQQMKYVHGMLPAKVIAYDAGPPSMVQVQPLMDVVTTDGTTVQRAAIASIPVVQLGGGGFVVSVPLNPGDLGWIFACDRDFALFMQSLSYSAPNTFRMKDFSSSIFIPAVLSGYNLSGGDAANFVIQSLDGTVKFSLGDGIANVVAPIVNVTGDTVNLAGSGGAKVARVGDSVVDGLIATGSDKVFSN